MKHTVQVGDMKVGIKGDEIITYALGSCLGLMVYDPVARVGGLLHAMLPLSKINPQKAESNPYMFVDKGVPILFKEVYSLGGEKARLIVKAAGCGSPMGKNEMFKIGERNYTILKKLLWKNGVLLKAEEIGDSISRTVRFDISTGRVIIKTGRQERLL
ncbi:MAG: chemotaxis protein CheD [Deltaproteobacteria bacterium]|nr:chemotaxis protein CheD [Deltaproteobacteria bacterium]